MSNFWWRDFNIFADSILNKAWILRYLIVLLTKCTFDQQFLNFQRIAKEEGSNLVFLFCFPATRFHISFVIEGLNRSALGLFTALVQILWRSKNCEIFHCNLWLSVVLVTLHKFILCPNVSSFVAPVAWRLQFINSNSIYRLPIVCLISGSKDHFCELRNETQTIFLFIFSDAASRTIITLRRHMRLLDFVLRSEVSFFAVSSLVSAFHVVWIVFLFIFLLTL